MSFTSDQLTAIETAIASGTLRVKYADREVQYASLTDLMRVRTLIMAALGLIGDDGGRAHKYLSHSKGLE